MTDGYDVKLLLNTIKKGFKYNNSTQLKLINENIYLNKKYTVDVMIDIIYNFYIENAGYIMKYIYYNKKDAVLLFNIFCDLLLLEWIYMKKYIIDCSTVYFYHNEFITNNTCIIFTYLKKKKTKLYNMLMSIYIEKIIKNTNTAVMFYYKKSSKGWNYNDNMLFIIYDIIKMNKDIIINLDYNIINYDILVNGKYYHKFELLYILRLINDIELNKNIILYNYNNIFNDSNNDNLIKHLFYYALYTKNLKIIDMLINKVSCKYIINDILELAFIYLLNDDILILSKENVNIVLFVINSYNFAHNDIQLKIKHLNNDTREFYIEHVLKYMKMFINGKLNITNIDDITYTYIIKNYIIQILENAYVKICANENAGYYKYVGHKILILLQNKNLLNTVEYLNLNEYVNYFTL